MLQMVYVFKKLYWWNINKIEIIRRRRRKIIIIGLKIIILVIIINIIK